MNKFIYICFILLWSTTTNAENISLAEILQSSPSKQILSEKSSAQHFIFSYKVHQNGNFQNTVFNYGVIGNVFNAPNDINPYQQAPKYYFPRNGRFRHGIVSSLWVGGVVNRDTLVSTGIDYDYPNGVYSFEFLPDNYFEDNYIDLSPRRFFLNASDFQLSQNTFQTTFVDTNSSLYWFQDFHPYDGRMHKPLGIKVTQTSYSWSYKYAEDFLIVDYEIENVGKFPIYDAYIGLYHEGAMHHTGEVPAPKLDDLEGFLESYPYEYEELGNEQINLAWTCDVDGDPYGGVWHRASTVNCLGIAPLYVPEEADVYNFNWWTTIGIEDWGPRKKDPMTGAVRKFNGVYGTPKGDKNKYYLMAHPEVDYSGYEASVDYSNRGWIEPTESADAISDGHHVNYLLSWGPFDLEQQDRKHLTLVLSVGQYFHTVPSAYRDIFNPLNPKPFMDQLDFEDLINNVRWAKRIYDNPGVDTDLDGDSGKYIFIVDSLTFDSTQVFYEGDGVPDFKGAEPPPPPEIRVRSEYGKIIIRWNGRDSENYYDTFSNARDFEGYRVYISRSKDEQEFVLLTSFDTENYNRFEWNRYRHDYVLRDLPFKLDTLKILYGQDFNPLEYNRLNPLIADGKTYYFDKMDYNMSDIYDTENIYKVYPDALNDTTDVDAEGRMRYFEYETVIDNLLPSVPYYVSVTAFDFGYPAKSLEPLESHPYQNIKLVYAVNADKEDILKDDKLNVYCYPNPYLIDADYAGAGYENRGTDLHIDRARNIYFANLPEKCMISIYTLDGDLVRKLDHNKSSSDGDRSIHRWDLITRNTQTVVSGLYYWVVESEYGNQIGKLMIIR